VSVDRVGQHSLRTAGSIASLSRSACSAVALALSCAAHEAAGNGPVSQQPESPPSTVSVGAQGSEPQELALAAEPSDGRGTVRPLAVPGFEPALLFTPAGDSRRPLVVAAHGAGGGPEWECEYWRRLTRARAFILCLSGTPLGSGYSGYFFRDHLALNRELIAAEQAARAAEPLMLPGSGIYAGFSQGATMGTAIIALHADAFPYAVFIEGFMSWNVPGVRKFVRAGGRRVLLACGSKECAAVGKTSLRWFQAAGADARLEHAPGAGHTPAGPVMAKIESALPWLLDDDPNWQ
jgi:hypothetical protein